MKTTKWRKATIKSDKANIDAAIASLMKLRRGSFIPIYELGAASLKKYPVDDDQLDLDFQINDDEGIDCCSSDGGDIMEVYSCIKKRSPDNMNGSKSEEVTRTSTLGDFDSPTGDDAAKFYATLQPTLKTSDLVGAVKFKQEAEQSDHNSAGSDGGNMILNESVMMDDVKEIDEGSCLITQAALTEFKLVRMIGQGAFAKVFLAKRDDGSVFAVKRIRKDVVMVKSSIESLVTEQKVLSQVDHPFLLNIKHIFESPERYYFFTDYIAGGDLLENMRRRNGGFSLTEIKYISAQIVLALEYLHGLKYIHRDMKPENILIDQHGYIRLADFGLANSIRYGRPSEVAGTLCYMAPEVLDGDSEYGFEVDWWSLGVIMYELYYCSTPFEEDLSKATVKNIQALEVDFPEYSAKHNQNFAAFKSLVSKLLVKDPARRLGHSASGNGAKKVKNHRFFNTINWRKVLEMKEDPPYVPDIDLDALQSWLNKRGCHIGLVRTKSRKKSDLLETKLTKKAKRYVKEFNESRKSK